MSFIHRQISIGVALTVLFFVSVATIFAFFYFREVIYSYNISIPEANGIETLLEYGSWPELANVDFFNNVRNKFIVDKVSFVEANLSSMKLKLYDNGAQTNEFNILTKGREGSWWETPAGLYKVETKEKNHFSSFGKVYQPWSIQFQGNFFIHGWPYYENGNPVSSQYSGGCIRLSTDDAKTIFDTVKIGMPVLVYEGDSASGDNFVYERKIPEISATNYLAADIKNNFVFVKKDENATTSIASITKLITALVTVEYTNLENSITIDSSMLVKTSKSRLWAGQTVTAYQLLHPLLMESSNEAAVALSDFLGPERFVNLMNMKAKAIGMENSSFVDPAGSGEGNISNATDLFNLAKYLYNNRSFILKLTAGRINDSAYGAPLYNNLENFNVFEDDPDFIGGKVGQTTAAGETMLALFNIVSNGTQRPVAIIVLNSTDNAGDVNKILDYIKSQF